MNRSLKFTCKCCIPYCENTTTNSRNKLFIHVPEIVKSRWSREANIEFKPGRVYCCEDHLNVSITFTTSFENYAELTLNRFVKTFVSFFLQLEEDLLNLQFCKLMKGRPRLKPTAKLRYVKQEKNVCVTRILIFIL